MDPEIHRLCGPLSFDSVTPMLYFTSSQQCTIHGICFTRAQEPIDNVGKGRPHLTEAEEEVWNVMSNFLSFTFDTDQSDFFTTCVTVW